MTELSHIWVPKPKKLLRPRGVERHSLGDVAGKPLSREQLNALGIGIGISIGKEQHLGGAPAETPVTIMGANCLQWWRADLGNTIATDGNWVDQVGALTLAQGTAANRPTQSANGGPNSMPMMTFDGSNDSLAVSLVRAAPGTTTAVIWFIFRQNTWTINDPLFNDGAATFRVAQITAEPTLALFAGGSNQASNSAGTTLSWFRGQATFTNSTSDETLIGGTPNGAGASCGNTAGTQFLIGRNAGSTLFADFSLAEVALFNAKPSAGQKSSLDAYVTGRYGAGLV